MHKKLHLLWHKNNIPFFDTLLRNMKKIVWVSSLGETLSLLLQGFSSIKKHSFNSFACLQKHHTFDGLISYKIIPPSTNIRHQMVNFYSLGWIHYLTQVKGASSVCLKYHLVNVYNKW